MDATALSCNRHVVHAGCSQLLLLVPRLAEDGVGMRIDESRGENPAPTIDELAPTNLRLRSPSSPTAAIDRAVGEDGATRSNSRIAQLWSAARPRWPRTRDDLGCVVEKPLHRADQDPRRPNASTSSTREGLSGAWDSPRQA
jgi:hypothetical protein